MATPTIRVGIAQDMRPKLPTIQAAHPVMERHAATPWMRRRAEAYYGVSLAPHVPSPAGFSVASLAKHCFVLGKTRFGKTRALLGLVSAQLRSGCSVVAIDPKPETLLHIAAEALSAGIPAERIVSFLPGSGRAPGWNPLLGSGAGQAASDFADLLWAVSDIEHGGHQMGEVLRNSVAVVAAHGLSAAELLTFLRSQPYRERLLSLPSPPGREVDLDMAREYVRAEFDRNPSWGPPVTNKISKLLNSSPYLRAVVTADRNDVDLESLWKRPGVVLIQSSPEAEGMSNEAARILVGMAAWGVFRAAARSGGGPVPVVLSLDELGLGSGMLIDALSKILAIAAGRNLRLCSATQWLSQISDGRPPRGEGGGDPSQAREPAQVRASLDAYVIGTIRNCTLRTG